MGNGSGFSASGVEAGHVSPNVFVHEIDANRPVLVGMSTTRRTPGQAEHVALVVGYRDDGGELELVVNDPYPYSPLQNPYLHYGGTQLAPNQYRIAYTQFRDGVFWHWTVHSIGV
jgi:hypothetical protein